MILLAGSVSVEAIEPLEGVNLLSGKEAAFSLKPAYRYCSGGDKTDLTDGKFWQSGGETGFWTDKGTVGWSVSKVPWGVITFDLGQVQPIKTLAFDTVAGQAQVTFPAAVLVYVSDDGKTWHYVTDLINEALPQTSFIRHRFVAADLKTRGRYLAFYVVKGGFFAFVDEIEAIKGDHDLSAVVFKGEAIDKDKIESDALILSKNTVQKTTTLYFIKSAQNEIEASQAGAAGTNILKKLQTLRQEAAGRVGVEKVDYTKGLPYTDMGRQLCRTMGTYFEDISTGPLTAWKPTGSFWSHKTNPFARPGKATAPELHADMMIGELEPVAFNVSNNTAKPMTIEIHVSDLKGATRASLWSNSKVERRITTHVLASGYQFFDDALTPFVDSVTIPAGMTRQVWLILNSRDIKPDQYTATVTVTRGTEKYKLPLTATVYPVEMPKNPAYTSPTWAYFTWKPAKGYEKQAAAELERAYANAHVLHHYYIPWPKADKETKKMIRPVELDFTRLDEMISYRPYVRQWILWPGFEFGMMSLNYGKRADDMPKIGTPEYESLFKEWVRQIRDHMKEKGFGTDRWVFKWTDEPGEQRFLDFIVPSSRLAKQVDPTILVWEDHQIPMNLLEKYPDAIDIHCSKLGNYRSQPELLKHVLAEKQPSLQLQYLCGSSKMNDPHQYYRLHHMASVALGLNGGGMWVWGDDGGQFSDYQGKYPGYGMVYATENGPIAGKRREAWREGIEDVELWRHLKIAAEKTANLELKQLYEQTPDKLLYKGEETTGPHTGTVDDLMKQKLEILQVVSNTIK